MDYVGIAGVAVILYGLERFTRDLDIFINPTQQNIDHLKEALNSVFKDPSIKEIHPNDFKKFSVIRYGTPDGFYIDIITKIDKAISFKDLKHKIIEYNNIKINIATPETLYHLKKNTVRPQDKMDALFLKELLQTQKSKNKE